MRVILSPASRHHPEWSCQRKLTIVGDWSMPIPLRSVILVRTARVVACRTAGLWIGLLPCPMFGHRAQARRNPGKTKSNQNETIIQYQ